jgi:hypothetical protein
MARFFRRFLDRNVLLAFGVLPPTLFLLDGHVWLGLVFLACVVAARFSVEPHGSPQHRGLPTGP